MADKKKQVQPKHHASKNRVIAKLRRKQIIKELSSGKTLQKTGEAVGLNPKTAASQVSQILNEPQMQESFKALLDKVIPDDIQASKYKEILNATIVNKDSEQPDYAVQLRCNDSISKLKGHLVEKHEVDMSGGLMAIVKKQLNGENGKQNHTRASKKS